MKSNTETIVDDNGFELVIEYQYDKSKEYYEEECNIGTFVPATVYTKLYEIKLAFAGEYIIIPHAILSEKQKEFIISKLTHSND